MTTETMTPEMIEAVATLRALSKARLTLDKSEHELDIQTAIMQAGRRPIADLEPQYFAAFEKFKVAHAARAVARENAENAMNKLTTEERAAAIKEASMYKWSAK